MLVVTAVVAAGLPGIGTAKQVDQFGRWVYEESIDPITDEVSYTGHLASRHDSPEAAVIMIGCSALKSPLRIAVKFDAYLGSGGGTRDFTYRAGKAEAVTESWRYLEGDIVGTELPTDEASPLRQALATRGILYVRAMASNGRTIDASFDISSGDNVVTRLMIDCKLDPRFL
ncbi:MAG: hypothetical protein QM698_11455 [Micropepsaceae bacterium]